MSTRPADSGRLAGLRGREAEINGLKDRAYIVAGGATGIGAGAAERLGTEGALVTVGDVAIDKARATAERIARAGGRVIAVEFDLADESSIERLVSAAIAEFGRLDGLFNVGADLRAANDGRDLDLLTTGLDVWQRTFDVNLLGYVRTIRAVLPHLLGQGAGSIVNTSSGASLGNGDPRRPAYACTKAGVNVLTRHVAANWGRQGVRCNCVLPGYVMGELQVEANNTQLQEMFLQQVPTTRLGRPSDLASVVAFLLSDEAEWINGQVWSIDGGAHMQ